jgi:hypothetical protein
MNDEQAEIDQKLHALYDAVGLLKSWYSAHLEDDHGSIDRQILSLGRRLTRLENVAGIADHGLIDRLNDAPDASNPKRKRGRPRKNAQGAV